MSRENVEIVKAAIDAANREDWDALVQTAAPNFELDMSRSRSFRGASVYGLDQLRGFLVDFAESWESVRVEPHEFIEAGDLVVVPWTTHARGRDGIEVVSRPTFVWTIRDGAIERLSMYQERREAIEALGLSESAMSKADIETLRGVYEAISRGDWDAAFRDAHPGLEYKVLDRDPGTGTYRGREEVRRVLEDQLEAFEEVVAEPEEFFRRGDQIVVFVRVRSRPRGSSATVEIHVAHLWTMRDGKAARFELFPVREEALEAVGLSKQDAHGDS
jgi:hypothetical protein